VGVELTTIPWVHAQELDCVPLRRSADRSRPNPKRPLLTRQPKLQREGFGQNLGLGVGDRQQALLGKVNGTAQIRVAIEELVEKQVNVSSGVAASIAHDSIVAAKWYKLEILRWNGCLSR
jgi:hypothetical protein